MVDGFNKTQKNPKPVKRSKLIAQEPETFENPNAVDIKSAITEPPKALHKLLKTIQKERVSQEGASKSSNSSLYSETKKIKILRSNKMYKQNEHMLLKVMQVEYFKL